MASRQVVDFIVKYALAALLLAPTAVLPQADYARESRWAEEITPSILVGDPVMLSLPNGRRFLAIHSPDTKSSAGVVVVHGLGVHPDWGLNNPLRSRLAELGYTTLSVQMPVLAADAKAEHYPPVFPEAAERLAAAVAFLRDKGLKKIAVVSHSLGSRMTNEYLNRGGATAVDAWISIGMPGLYQLPPSFRSPTLDLYGEKDFPAVLQNTAARAAAIARLRGSAQVEVPGADHFFNGHETELVRQVRLFLDQRLK